MVEENEQGLEMQSTPKSRILNVDGLKIITQPQENRITEWMRNIVHEEHRNYNSFDETTKCSTLNSQPNAAASAAETFSQSGGRKSPASQSEQGINLVQQTDSEARITEALKMLRRELVSESVLYVIKSKATSEIISNLVSYKYFYF